jgi:hypothetical protein
VTYSKTPLSLNRNSHACPVTESFPTKRFPAKQDTCHVELEVKYVLDGQASISVDVATLLVGAGETTAVGVAAVLVVVALVVAVTVVVAVAVVVVVSDDGEGITFTYVVSPPQAVPSVATAIKTPAQSTWEWSLRDGS